MRSEDMTRGMTVYQVQRPSWPVGAPLELRKGTLVHLGDIKAAVEWEGSPYPMREDRRTLASWLGATRREAWEVYGRDLDRKLVEAEETIEGARRGRLQVDAELRALDGQAAEEA